MLPVSRNALAAFVTVRRLAMALRLPAAADPDIDRRLRKADEMVARWKSRFEHRSATLARLKDALERRRRDSLSPRVLKQILAVRAHQRPVLASDVAAAADREERLLAASCDYASLAGDDVARLEPLVRMEVLGVPWWLPRDEGCPGRVTKLAGQGLPLRAILQTRELSLGGVMLDVGANVGRTSIPRVLLGDVRAVYAAEPEPVNYRCLVQNVFEHRLRGYVLPDRVAIGATRASVRLRRSSHIGGHRVLAAERRHKDRPKERRQGVPVDAASDVITVECWPLDAWMGKLAVEPEAVSFVKVDTQGSEVAVLRGASSLLARRHVAWQMEVDPALLGRAGSSMRELIDLLGGAFTHFIDLGAALAGPRVQPTRVLADSLGYVGSSAHKTDLIVYNAAV
jgi:FkbM family methyltransferase